MSALVRIPKINLNTEQIANRAQNQGLWCMRGEPMIFEYIVDSNNVLITSNHNGYLMIPHETIGQVVDELKHIKENLHDIKMEVKGA
ncbi:MAG: hypothetical protein ACLRLX_06485 [Anaerovoracaceae bacterium]